MKSNAIIRIIVFSILIVLLSGLLLAGLNLDRFWSNTSASHGGQTVGPVASDESATMGAVSADKITELDIEWAAGKILIQPSEEADTIRFWDDYAGDEKLYLYYTTAGNKLSIQYCKDLDWDDGFGVSINNTINKNLTIQVPAGWVCENLEVDAASATLEVHDLTIQEAEIDAASGALGFENCNVYSLDVDTASGDVIFTGSLQTLDCDAASASVAANLSNIPTRINVSTMSSNIDLTLPENAGFTLNMDGLSATMHSDFDCTLENGRYVCGDGSCHIQVDSLSGKVYLRKNTTPISTDVTAP